MTLLAESFVHAALCVNVSGAGSLGRIKSTEVDFFSGDADSGLPAIEVFTDATDSCLAAHRCHGDVLAVNDIGCLSKVSNSIVSFYAVTVINQSARPNPVHIQPCSSVRLHRSIVNADDSVAATINKSSLHAADGLLASSVIEPSEISGDRIVVKDFSNPIGCEIFVCHKDPKKARLSSARFCSFATRTNPNFSAEAPLRRSLPPEYRELEKD